MHYSTFYPQDISEEEIIAAILADGYSPKKIVDEPHYIYKEHSHPESKEIVCLRGSMVVSVNGRQFAFRPGDKIIIPGNTLHSAVVGDGGCTYLWSEKI